ncbi:MAG: S-methyl-5-thioribose-1-phosphate isomerase [Thermoanaerobaculia bacterium]|nr:S-methyl-5-thioribose-1-phosphate isomerase [Thermoanaerobaculia bacterium]
MDREARDEFTPLRWRDGALELLDQTRLPGDEVWLRLTRVGQVADAIRRLAVRGAPAIGIAAAYGLVVALGDADDPERDPARRFAAACRELLSTRPTAVNLRWALEAGAAAYAGLSGLPADRIAAGLLAWASALHADDVERNRRMAAHGAELFAAGDRALTHCNAGALATGGIGTAIGVLGEAFRRGRLAEVWVDETRPLLQGARLTAWEMERLGIPHRVVTDSMVGALMRRGLVDRVVVGSDRVVANGDFANKIGTYTVAVLAQRHGVPFYVAAPLSTYDVSLATGDEIPIEERDGDEVATLAGRRICPAASPGFNLAFDVTPAELVTAHVNERGVLLPPFGPAIAAALR